MTKSLFVTGTDTEVGKTWCTLALIQYLKNQGLRVAGMKPIASGCRKKIIGFINSDAEQILELSGLDLPYNLVNPYAFYPAIAPHIAAKQIGQHIDLNHIINKYQQLAAQADIVVVEGAGGWRVPINATESMKDIALAMKAQVILVVGLRLGCINHALLTAETILADGCHLAGWIANPLEPKFDSKASIDTISERLEAPLLATMPCLAFQDISLLSSKFQNFLLNN
jgi:dethiobiotin synthetase